jgi:hypothetical protein
MFPPGRARLATCPRPTGSAWTANTIGIVLVARRAASTSVDDEAKMTSTFMRTSSAASSGSWSNPFRPSPLDDDVIPLDVAEVTQARPQCLYWGGPSRSGADPQVADPRRFRRLPRVPRAATR